MNDHLALYVDRLITSSTLEKCLGVVASASSSSPYRPPPPPALGRVGSDVALAKEKNRAEWDVECRICQEEDGLANLETPCSCSGSLKFAHRKCVQRWCNEKGDTMCEICRQPFASGYTAPIQPIHAQDIPIDFRGNWGITGPRQLDLHDPRVLALAAERHLLGANGYDEYASGNISGAACFRFTALILMALLLLRHTFSFSAGSTEQDPTTIFILFLLRAAGFLLPCYIMARAMNILQRRRQRQEAAMAAADVAMLLQTGQPQGI